MHNVGSTTSRAGTMHTCCISFKVQLPAWPAFVPGRKTLEVPCMPTRTQRPLRLWLNCLDSLSWLVLGCLWLPEL
jgi:hypothetical protein